MDSFSPDDGPSLAFDTPEAHFDAIRDHPEWTDRRRAEELDLLVRRFPPELCITAVQKRLGDLHGGDAEPMLRLIEAHPSPELLRELAEALEAQVDLAPERAWDALALLDGQGMLEGYPALFERWQELNEAFDEDGSIHELAEGLEADPDGIWLALQGLGAVEPEVRAEIVASLARAPHGPGLIEFFRLLCYSHDPTTQTAALDALGSLEGRDPRVAAAWSAIANDPPGPEASSRSARWLGTGGLARTSSRTLDLPAPKLTRVMVTALDSHGRGAVVLSTESGGSHMTVAFLCDVEQGVREAIGQVSYDRDVTDAFFNEVAGQPDRECIEGASELALDLLAGGLLLCGTETSPALRYWLEQTVGPRFRPRPVPVPFPGWDPSSVPFDEIPECARTVLAALPTWLDASRLTYDLAEEIVLREGDSPPDPRRDSGAYRYMFEHRLVGQLELYRRMFSWMAAFWEAAGDLKRGKSALALAKQLSDPQHAVPAHPFTIALTTRSLSAAQANLRNGIDPRRGPTAL